MTVKFDSSGLMGIGLIIYGIIKKDYLTLIIGVGFVAPTFDFMFKRR